MPRGTVNCHTATPILVAWVPSSLMCQCSHDIPDTGHCIRHRLSGHVRLAFFFLLLLWNRNVSDVTSNIKSSLRRGLTFSKTLGCEDLNGSKVMGHSHLRPVSINSFRPSMLDSEILALRLSAPNFPCPEVFFYPLVFFEITHAEHRGLLLRSGVYLCLVTVASQICVEMLPKLAIILRSRSALQRIGRPQKTIVTAL